MHSKIGFWPSFRPFTHSIGQELFPEITKLCTMHFDFYTYQPLPSRFPATKIYALGYCHGTGIGSLAYMGIQEGRILSETTTDNLELYTALPRLSRASTFLQGPSCITISSLHARTKTFDDKTSSSLSTHQQSRATDRSPTPSPSFTSSSSTPTVPFAALTDLCTHSFHEQ